MDVLIRRCAWHREYRGYPMVYGIGSWHRFEVTFTDGMCRGCAVDFRRQWNLPPPVRGGLTLSNQLARAAVVVLALASFTLAARPLDDARTRETPSVLPETVLIPPVPVEEEPMPALAVASRLRGAGGDTSVVADAGASSARSRAVADRR